MSAGTRVSFIPSSEKMKYWRTDPSARSPTNEVDRNIKIVPKRHMTAMQTWAELIGSGRDADGWYMTGCDGNYTLVGPMDEHFSAVFLSDDIEGDASSEVKYYYVVLTRVKEWEQGLEWGALDRD